MSGKVLVTGGLGMVGGFVCRALLAHGRQPVIYDLRGDTSLVRDIESECVIEQGETRDQPKLMSLIASHRPEAIVHLAAQVGPEVETWPWTSIQSNFIGTVTVFECARLGGVPKVVFPSSKMIYGPVAEAHRHPHYAPVTEDHPRNPPKLYGKIKRMCEDAADHYAQLYGLDIIALRFGSAFAPGKAGRFGKLNPVMGMIEAAIAGEPYTIEHGGDHCDDLCYSGESANGVVAALAAEPRPGSFRAYNIASGELISLARMAEVVQSVFPGWTYHVGPGLDYRGYGSGYYYLMSTEKARAELGFRPQFDYRAAVVNYRDTLERLRHGIR